MNEQIQFLNEFSTKIEWTNTNFKWIRQSWMILFILDRIQLLHHQDQHVWTEVYQAQETVAGGPLQHQDFLGKDYPK